VLLADVTVPSTNPAAVIAAWAFAWVSPVTVGTLLLPVVETLSVVDASLAPSAQAVTIVATNMDKNIEEIKLLECLA
jgi:hypothetical protein